MEGNYGKEFELAIPVDVQQKAALYGVGAGLLKLKGKHNKEDIKKVMWGLDEEVYLLLGDKGSAEILSQNEQAVLSAISGIKNDPRLSKEERDKVLNTISEDLYSTFLTGLAFQEEKVV